MEYKGIMDWKFERSFVSRKGNKVEVIGTASAVNRNANGWCACSYGYKWAGVCWRCYLVNTYDMIKVNGVMAGGAYRRGTVMKIAGCRVPEVGLICTDDNAVTGRLFEEIFGVEIFNEKIFSKYERLRVKEIDSGIEKEEGEITEGGGGML